MNNLRVSIFIFHLMKNKKEYTNVASHHSNRLYILEDGPKHSAQLLRHQGFVWCLQKWQKKEIKVLRLESKFLKWIEVSYYDISLLYSRIQLKWICLCYCAKSWRQNTFRVLHWKCSSHFMFLILFSNRMLHPFIFSIRFSDRISLSFPVYKLLFLI